MEYYSTLDHTRHSTLGEAVMRGIAADGGLYVPVEIRRLPDAFFKNIADMGLRDIAYVAAHSLLSGDLRGRDIQDVIAGSLSFEMPLRQLEDDVYALELFHGPTLSFKDVGTRFMARLLGYLRPSGGRVNVVVATSGDTGGAVAAGFCGMEGVDVWVLYPTHAAGRIAEARWATEGGNIHPIAVNAGIDECRAMVKQLIGDADTARRLNLVTANSINIWRLLPQTFYYFHAYAQLLRERPDAPAPVIAVPAGNLGNLTAGVIAARMGLPVERFIAVNNRNDAFVRYLATGRVQRRAPVHTLAPALDVGEPSNLPRLAALYGGDYRRMGRDISGVSVSDDDISATINHFDETADYLLDPHSAAACHGLRMSLPQGCPGIFLATAHPAKFRHAVETVTGHRVTVPERYRRSAANVLPLRHHDRVAPNAKALEQFMIKNL